MGSFTRQGAWGSSGHQYQFEETVTATGIASAEAFGSPSVGAFVIPTGIASGEAFGTAVVTGGSATVVPTGIASGEAFGTATVSVDVVPIQPSGIASGETFGTPIIAEIAVYRTFTQQSRSYVFTETL